MKTPKPDPNHPIFTPIKMGKLPTMPVPWLSADSGETWIWNNFFIIFQKDPPSFLNLVSLKKGPLGASSPIKYPFILSVFYHLQKSPHGPSRTPIFVAAIETSPQLDVPIVSVFQQSERSNLGFFKGHLTRETARLHLLAVTGEWLSLTGKPHKIGTIHDAAGHPETGLPPAHGNSPTH